MNNSTVRRTIWGWLRYAWPSVASILSVTLGMQACEYTPSHVGIAGAGFLDVVIGAIAFLLFIRLAPLPEVSRRRGALRLAVLVGWLTSTFLGWRAARALEQVAPSGSEFGPTSGTAAFGAVIGALLGGFSVLVFHLVGRQLMLIEPARTRSNDPER